jgi:hypothetical protein
MKNFIDKYIATLIAVLIVGLHYLPYSQLGFLAVFGHAPFAYFESDYLGIFGSLSLCVFVFFIITGKLYFMLIKKHKKLNEFRIAPLMLYYLTLLISIHQLYYFSLIIIKGIRDGDYRYDGNDFIGVWGSSYESCFIFIIFGLIIDFIKNKNAVPKVKF